VPCQRRRAGKALGVSRGSCRRQLLADFVAKLREGRLASNDVTEARRFLNQHCVSATNLESSLRARMRKIVLQQYRHYPEVFQSENKFRLLRCSGLELRRVRAFLWGLGDRRDVSGCRPGHRRSTKNQKRVSTRGISRASTHLSSVKSHSADGCCATSFADIRHIRETSREHDLSWLMRGHWPIAAWAHHNWQFAHQIGASTHCMGTRSRAELFRFTGRRTSTALQPKIGVLN
jgi:hypothetical protein